MHSEEMAKTLWCPMTRVLQFQPAPDHNFPVNRPDNSFNCIASGCMMWREGITGGYCGLAGRPHEN